MALTRLSDVKTLGKIVTDADDGLLNSLIAGISDLVEQLCDRTFGTATYREHLISPGTCEHLAQNYPITNLVLAMYGTQDVISVSYSGSVGDIASVTVTDASVTLLTFSAGAAVQTTLAKATYPTMTLMAAAISAVSGWTGTVQDSNDAAMSSYLLRPMMTGSAIGGGTVYLAAPYDVLDCRIDPLANSIIKSDSVLDDGEHVFLWYVAGYTLPTLSTTGNLPAGLMLTVNRLVLESYGMLKRDLALGSESIGRYSYSVNDAVREVTLSHQDDLAAYRRLTI